MKHSLCLLPCPEMTEHVSLCLVSGSVGLALARSATGLVPPVCPGLVRAERQGHSVQSMPEPPLRATFQMTPALELQVVRHAAVLSRNTGLYPQARQSNSGPCNASWNRTSPSQRAQLLGKITAGTPAHGRQRGQWGGRRALSCGFLYTYTQAIRHPLGGDATACRTSPRIASP